jgi:hypothetical protein
MRHLNISPHSSYWSLCFTPDDDDDRGAHHEAEMELRLTVHVDGGAVCEALAHEDEPPPLASRKALAEWALRAGVQYNASIDDEN